MDFLFAKGDYVIAQPSDQKSNSGLEVVDNSQEQKYLEVVFTGDEVTRCKPGDKVLPYGQQFQAFKWDGKTYLVLKDEEIIGVFNTKEGK